MKLAIGFLTLFLSGVALAEGSLTLVGNIPGQYLDKDKNTMTLGFIEIENRVIKSMGAISGSAADYVKANSKKKILVLKRKNSYDVIYPGLINLHNHTKQNNLPIWKQAQGQFENRFEWRDWGNYTKSVSGNMNPWVGFGKPIECATFRWSEVQAMVFGTTYLQGPSNCVAGFGIQRVEDAGAYVSKKAAVQAPTDLIIPEDMVFVWNVLGPIIRSGKTYEEALAQTINKYCTLTGISAETVNTKEGLAILKNQTLLKEKCQGDLPNKFIRYVYWIHPTIAGKKAYMAQANASAIIAHLAEGRRTDPYNMKEFELVKMLGLDLPGVNFVHGVGIKKSDLKIMGEKKMGLIWSPLSNFLLYGETLDIKAAKEAGVVLALGSDWLPTGSKSVLEELKVARNYVQKDPLDDGLAKIFTDEELYKMVTENAAKLIGHYENAAGEAGVGRLAIGSMGTVIVATAHDGNPFTNLVKDVSEKDINLVIVDGKAVYGNVSYLDGLGLKGKYETSPFDYQGFADLKTDTSVPSLAVKASTAESEEDTGSDATLKHLIKLGKFIQPKKFSTIDICKFDENKGFVFQDTLAKEPVLAEFQSKSGMNLDRVSDLAKILAINILTQNRNVTDPKEGDPKYALEDFVPLYSCNDSAHTSRVYSFVRTDGVDEYTKNLAERKHLRAEQSHGAGPERLNANYPD